METSKEEMRADLLKSFHDQFASNQNHHQTIFIQFISAVIVVMIGYGIVYANTGIEAKLFELTRNSTNKTESYSVIHLVGTFVISEFILVLLASLILNIGYSFRRDQKVVYNIRQYYLESELYTTIFEKKSFNPTQKKLIFDSFLPGFNLIFVCFIYFLQILLLVSLIIAVENIKSVSFTFWARIGFYCLIISPILLSAKYLQHYFKKYKKTVN
jgi:hypothetical protein